MKRINQNITNKNAILIFTIGFFFVLFGLLLFNSVYDRIIAEKHLFMVDTGNLSAVQGLIVGTALCAAGIAIILLLFSESWARYIVISLVGLAIIFLALYKEKMRVALFMFAVIIVFGAVFFVFYKIIATMLTFSVFIALEFAALWGITKVFEDINNKPAFLVLYVISVLFSVVYLIVGVALNRWTINKIMGFELESKEYDYTYLKNHILFIYLVLFFLINVAKYMGKIDSDLWDFVNNTFLTLIAVTQVDWNVFKIKLFENKKVEFL